MKNVVTVLLVLLSVVAAATAAPVNTPYGKSKYQYLDNSTNHNGALTGTTTVSGPWAGPFRPLTNAAAFDPAGAAAGVGTGVTNALNVSSNSIVGVTRGLIGTASNSLQSGVSTLGVNLTNDVNTTSNALQQQISSSGITAPALQDSLSSGTNTFNGTGTLTNAIFSAGISTVGNVQIERGSNTLFFTSLTNALAAVRSGDVVKLPVGTNYIDNAATPLISLPQNVAIIGEGMDKSWIAFNTNVCLFTNNNFFKDFSCISTTLYSSPNLVWAFRTVDAGSSATNCIWKNVGIRTYGNGIQQYNGSSGAAQWLIDGCDIISGQRGVFLASGSGVGQVTIKNTHVKVTENTNNISVTLVGFSLSDNGSNFVDNCKIEVDANMSSNAVEYLGFFSGSGSNWLTKTFFQHYNTNNVPMRGAVVGDCLFETAGLIATDGSVSSDQFSYNYGSSDSLQQQLGGDWTKLGVDELNLQAGSGIAITSNAMYDIPNPHSALLFDPSSASVTKWTQHFSGLPALAFDFSSLTPGWTNNIVFTNSALGLSVVFAATNRIWVTNLNGSGPTWIMSSSGADPILITNIGGNFTTYRGSFQELTNLANANLDGFVGNPTTIAPNLTNAMQYAWGDWNALWTNITSIRVRPINRLGGRIVGLTNFWCANAIPLARAKTFSISATGGVPWTPVSVWNNCGPINAGANVAFTPRADGSGNSAISQLVPYFTSTKGQIWTNITFTAGATGGVKIGAGTNVMLRLFTNDVLGYTLTFQGDGSSWKVQDTSSAVLIPANASLAFAVSNCAASAAIPDACVVTITAQAIPLP